VNPVRIIAFVLVIGGLAGLAYGGFSYTKQNHEAKIGPVELSVSEKKTVDVPTWAALGALLVGGALLFAGGKRS
jgi:TRAP-type C4-dicarboxylate transport system permease small subunit